MYKCRGPSGVQGTERQAEKGERDGSSGWMEMEWHWITWMAGLGSF